MTTKPCLFGEATLASPLDVNIAATLAGALAKTGDEMIGFVGAGVSVAAGYPPWEKLLNGIHDAVNASRPEQNLSVHIRTMQDVMWRAEEYHDYSPGEYRNAIAAALRLGAQGPVPSVVQSLASLKFRHFITTNYDACLQEALTNQSSDSRPIVWQASRAIMPSLAESTPRKLVYLHGSNSEPQTIILRNSDYRSFYLDTDKNTKQLFSIFSTYRICFFGCSLTDVHVMRILEQVHTLNVDDPRHFAVLPNPGENERTVQRRMLMRRYGIVPIYYDLPNGTFGEFEKLIIALASNPTEKSPLRRSSKGTAFAGPVPNPSAPQDDPNVGRFGGLPCRDGLVLDASVRAIGGSNYWFAITLTVSAVSGETALDEGSVVEFDLHPTFSERVMKAEVEQGQAVLEIEAYGAFTVGVIVPDRTCLELDLAKLEDAPPLFRSR